MHFEQTNSKNRLTPTLLAKGALGLAALAGCSGETTVDTSATTTTTVFETATTAPLETTTTALPTTTIAETTTTTLAPTTTTEATLPPAETGYQLAENEVLVGTFECGDRWYVIFTDDPVNSTNIMTEAVVMDNGTPYRYDLVYYGLRDWYYNQDSAAYIEEVIEVICSGD